MRGGKAYIRALILPTFWKGSGSLEYSLVATATFTSTA